MMPASTVYRLFFAVVVMALPLSAEAQLVLYVDGNRATNGDGLTWATAYNNLQDALADAGTNGATHTIRVAGATYRPHCMPDPCVGTNGDREATFELIDGVAIWGGYRGCLGGSCYGADPMSGTSTYMRRS